MLVGITRSIRRLGIQKVQILLNEDALLPPIRPIDRPINQNAHRPRQLLPPRLRRALPLPQPLQHNQQILHPHPPPRVLLLRQPALLPLPPQIPPPPIPQHLPHHPDKPPRRIQHRALPHPRLRLDQLQQPQQQRVPRPQIPRRAFLGAEPAVVGLPREDGRNRVADLVFQPRVVERVGEWDEAVQPVGEAFVQPAVLGGPARPAARRDVRVEVVLVAGQPGGGEGECVAQPAGGFDRAEGEGAEEEGEDCGVLVMWWGRFVVVEVRVALELFCAVVTPAQRAAENTEDVRSRSFMARRLGRSR